MARCFVLAKQSTNKVKSNPNVGAVLVFKGRIIGEGRHEFYGGPHAEVNAFASVKEEDKKYIKEATLYVSLEPCNVDGKTPPCTSLILEQSVQKVIYATTDPNPQVAGRGAEILRSNGIEVLDNSETELGNQIIAPFRANLNGLPYVILKWAKSKDHYLSKKGEQIWLSNEFSKVYAHKLRSEVDGILIGANTAIIDDPSLTTREYPGKHPTRIIIDPNNKITSDLKIVKDGNPTIIFTKTIANKTFSNVEIITIDFEREDLLKRILKMLFDKGIYRLLVEGGAFTLSKFINNELWNEAHIITTQKLLQSGVKAPNLMAKKLKETRLIDNSVILCVPLENKR